MAGGHTRERTALIVTVLNESGTLDALLESLAEQTQAPDEVIVADGGSTDGTLEMLRSWSSRLPLRVLEVRGANIAGGRNAAIEATSAEWIAVTDAGVRLEPTWLSQLMSQAGPHVEVVSGFFRPDPRTPFERALGATTLPAIDDVKAQDFLPSSRSVLFRRAA